MKNIVWVFDTGIENMEISFQEVLTYAIIYTLVVIALYVLRSVGLYQLTKRQKIKNAWMAFIPFIWIYVASKLFGTLVLSGKPLKNFPLLVTIVFSISVTINFTINFLVYFPLVGYYLQGGEIYFANTTSFNEVLQPMGFEKYYFMPTSVFVRGILYPYSNYALVGLIVAILQRVNALLSLFSTFLTVFVYMGIFRKFWPQRYILATVLSILGVFPIMIFIIRNHKAINFDDYIRSRYYGHAHNPYGGVGGVDMRMGGESPVNRQNQKMGKEPLDPFEEFENTKSEKGEDPFGFEEEKK